jgi:hypothetical protein
MKKVLNSIFSFNVRNAFQLPDDIISLLTDALEIVRTELASIPVRAYQEDVRIPIESDPNFNGIEWR